MTVTMTDTDYTPRAWVGCLGCYSEGRLVGRWLEGDEIDDDDTLAGLCVRPDHEELWVFDHENLAASGEMSPWEAGRRARAVAGVIAAAEEYGVPVPVALEYVNDTNIDDPECWPVIGEDVSVWSADDPGDYVAEYLEECCPGFDPPSWLHIDYAASFDDLTSGLPQYRHDGTTYIFSE